MTHFVVIIKKRLIHLIVYDGIKQKEKNWAERSVAVKHIQVLYPGFEKYRDW